MAIDSVKTKLHEARSALSEMRDEEGKAAGESRYDHVHTCSAPWLPQGFGAVHNAQTPQGPTQLL